MKVSWVTIDRFCQEETEVNEDIRHDPERNGKPLRASAESLSDDELLTKLRDLGVDGDRDGVERRCADALLGRLLLAAERRFVLIGGRTGCLVVDE